jgi:hypothetical protein
MVGSIAAAQKEPCDGSGIASESLPTLPVVGSWSLGHPTGVCKTSRRTYVHYLITNSGGLLLCSLQARNWSHISTDF